MLTNLARCCKPAPPDNIVGYITRERGVTIHRQACPFITRLPEERRNRLLQASWGTSTNLLASVDIAVEAYDRQGLLRDISDLFVREKVNAIKVNLLSRNNRAMMHFSLEVTDLNQLQRILTQIQHMPDVISAQRRE